MARFAQTFVVTFLQLFSFLTLRPWPLQPSKERPRDSIYPEKQGFIFSIFKSKLSNISHNDYIKCPSYIVEKWTAGPALHRLPSNNHFSSRVGPPFTQRALLRGAGILHVDRVLAEDRWEGKSQTKNPVQNLWAPKAGKRPEIRHQPCLNLRLYKPSQRAYGQQWGDLSKVKQWNKVGIISHSNKNSHGEKLKIGLPVQIKAQYDANGRLQQGKSLGGCTVVQMAFKEMAPSLVTQVS